MKMFNYLTFIFLTISLTHILHADDLTRYQHHSSPEDREWERQYAKDKAIDAFKTCVAAGDTIQMVKSLDLLYANKVNCNEVDPHPLLIAVKNGHNELLFKLMDFGCHLITPEDKIFFLVELIENSDITIHTMRKLKAKGIDFSQAVYWAEGQHPITLKTEMIEYNLIGYALRISGSSGNEEKTNLEYDKIEVLLELGCDPEPFSAEMLFQAVQHDRVELAKMLLERGVKIENSRVLALGKPQLLLVAAAKFSSKEMIDLLIAYGCDKNEKDENGKTGASYTWLNDQKHPGVYNALKGAEKRKKSFSYFDYFIIVLLISVMFWFSVVLWKMISTRR